MCGIFGVLTVAPKAVGVDIKTLTRDLFLLSESRGKEASGIATYHQGVTRVAKRAQPASEFVRSEEFRQLFPASWGNASDAAQRAPFAAIGHCRLVTNGKKQSDDNNQPVQSGDVVAIHNGIVVNSEDLWQRNSDLTRHGEVDSEVIAALINKYVDQQMSLQEAAAKVFADISGAASVAVLCKKLGKIVLATNTGSLYAMFGQEHRLGLFASEEIFLKRMLGMKKYDGVLSDMRISHLKPGIGLVVDIVTGETTEFKVPLSSRLIPGGSQIVEVRSVRGQKESVLTPSGLKRCTRCVLPHTVPFIQFDNQGVCNFCHQHRPVVTRGEAALEAELAKYRRSDGRPDMIVTFSGGRDSSYALHLLKTKFKMNPLALTYDWGMVTDLARRNQARLCGQLGVEHILISANIEAKRSYIRKNVEAWLRKPNLGMIPLFMAGDKHFFYYFNKLSKQTGLDTVVLSVNPLEKTSFKVGFAGIDQGHHVLPYQNKFKLASFYGRQFLSNPRYFNTSLVDTLTAYVSAYFLRHDYLMFYDYVAWDEDQINRALIGEYGWEVASDCHSTWRIGDGTAAFYNYIYWKVAGFSENDSFRSNQIREGYITREQAIALLAQENQPRVDSMREYLELIGVEYQYAIDVIEGMPKLY